MLLLGLQGIEWLRDWGFFKMKTWFDPFLMKSWKRENIIQSAAWVQDHFNRSNFKQCSLWFNQIDFIRDMDSKFINNHSRSNSFIIYSSWYLYIQDFIKWFHELIQSSCKELSSIQNHSLQIHLWVSSNSTLFYSNLIQRFIHVHVINFFREHWIQDCKDFSKHKIPKF